MGIRLWRLRMTGAHRRGLLVGIGPAIALCASLLAAPAAAQGLPGVPVPSVTASPEPGAVRAPIVWTIAGADAGVPTQASPQPAGLSSGAVQAGAPKRERPFLDGKFMVGVSGSHVLTPDSDLG